MKTIAHYVREFLREQWHPGYIASVAALLAVAFFFNYGYDFESTVLAHVRHPAGQVAFYFVFYAVPYLLAHGAYAVSRRDFSLLRRVEFWVLSFFAFAVLSVYIALHDVPGYLLANGHPIFEGISFESRRFASRCASNVLPLLLMTVPLVMYWYRVNRDEMPLYGLSAKTIDLRPYFFILLFLIPLVVGASFTSDFQRAYPRYKFGFPEQAVGSERTLLAGIFQLCYGSDFVFVEFFFRGFMVLAFARMMGTRAIVPMVVVYALIHFQKPMLEAVSSIFGGLVLGVISYRTKSIYGGVILHLGIAYMMEIAGALQMPR